MTDQPPTLIGGRYKPDATMWSPPEGALYRATDTQLGRQVLVQVCEPEAAGPAVALVRQRHEISDAGGNVPVEVYEAGDHEGRNYVVFEDPGGVPAGAFFSEVGSADPIVILKAARQVALALQAVRDAGVTQWEMPPDSVFVDESGHGRLVLTVCAPGPEGRAPKGDAQALASLIGLLATGGADVDSEPGARTLPAPLDRIVGDLNAKAARGGSTAGSVASELGRVLDTASEATQQVRPPPAVAVPEAALPADDRMPAEAGSPWRSAAPLSDFRRRFLPLAGGAGAAIARLRLKREWALGGIALLLLLAVAGAVLLVTRQPQGTVQARSLAPAAKTVSVPDVVGKSPDDARAKLGDAGLNLALGAQEQSAAVPAGSVLAQDPAPGAMVAAGSLVTATISLGAPPTPIPAEVDGDSAPAPPANSPPRHGKDDKGRKKP
jgi:serine/threonine-protein kinase